MVFHFGVRRAVKWVKYFWGPLFFTGRGFVIFVGYCFFSGGVFAFILLADYIFCGLCVLWFLRFGLLHFVVYAFWPPALVAFWHFGPHEI